MILWFLNCKRVTPESENMITRSRGYLKEVRVLGVADDDESVDLLLDLFLREED